MVPGRCERNLNGVRRRLRITRLNVYAELVGLYLVRDAQDTGSEPNGLGVPGGAYEIPLILADRLFDDSGELFYSPDPTWIPEFFGDTPLVNGAVRPYLDVEPRKYRFRLLNASNARFWNLTIQGGPPAFQIGSDGGLFDRPVALSRLLLLPAERADVIVDFSRFAGQTLKVVNADLPADISSPAPPLANAMEIRVGRRVTSPGPAGIPARLPGAMPALGAPSRATSRSRRSRTRTPASPNTARSTGASSTTRAACRSARATARSRTGAWST
jgi:spore coat protein A